MRYILILLLAIVSVGWDTAGGWDQGVTRHGKFGNISIGTTATRANLDVNGTIYAHGNVGISSTSPQGALDVKGNVYATAYYGDGSNLSGVSASGGGGDPSPWEFLNGDVIYRGAGNVGIGTSDARVKLDVEGAVYLKGNIGVGTTAPEELFVIRKNGAIARLKIASTNGAALQMDAPTAQYSAMDFMKNGTVQWGYGLYPNSTTLHFWDAPSGDLRRLSVTLAGNVGIGSTDPRAMLDVQGTIYSTGPATFAGGQFIGTDESIYFTTVGVDANLYGTYNLAVVGGVATGSGFSVTPKSAVLNVDGIIYSHGNIGVGSSAPTSMLSVDGGVYVRGYPEGGKPINTDNVLYSVGTNLYWQGVQIN